MAMGPVATSSSDTPKIRELEGALNKIGTTAAHKKIVFLILIGCLFDSFEQNTVGITGPMLREQWGLTGGDIGLLNTITFGTAAAGRLLSGVISDKYGRRIMLGINLLLFTIGSLICASAPSFGLLCVGRAVVGFGLGGEISTAVTMLAEVSSTKFRGTAVGLVNVGAGGLGNFLAPAFGLLIFTLFPGPSGWRWLFLSLALPSLLIVFYRRYIPETPRYLLSKNKIAEANKVLSILASGKLNPKGLTVTSYLSDGGEPFKTGNAAWSEIFKPPYASRTIPVTIAILMSYGAQLSVLTLLPMMLVAQGYTLSTSLLFTMIIQTGSFLGTVSASAFGYMFPRKLVLTVGSICACVASLCFGFLGVNIYLLLFFGAVFQFFVLVLNTTIWIYAPELYPTRSRAFGVAFILASGTAAGAVMPLISGRVLDSYGLVGVFAMIAVMYGIFAACIQFGPETFGKSMEDLNIAALPEGA
ncbi:MFS transporter [Bradyrhizobium sp. LTSP849]|jgi:MFS family permease|uniref:MFS transporter n=1 Tax=unclassified Bradyrhizobium TaxID=2631580 RepID=UPI0005D2914C|nr:MFS transporter [Bradyrhizobium sp. LTSP857]KJC52651.1 MFS transporter [Bradyrhizobium sp. LTSP849]